MKSKLTVRRKPMKNRSQLFLIYTAAFLLCAAGVYACFIVKGRSLVVSGDGWKQHFTAFVYFGQYGRTALRTLLTEHQLVLPQWNFSLGYGGDILTTLHYYVIGDPLDLLSIACPTRYAVYLYSFLSLFRLYLAGLGFGAFCRYKKQGAPLPVAVGSVCYVFFTYSFLMVARHPFFALPMVYLPLLLLGVEQVLAKRRPYLLIVTVFLAAVSNFYFFYMLAIITAIYTVYRLCCLYDRHSAKQAMSGLLQVTLWAVVGALMSAAILLPVVLAFMNDTRTAGYQFNWFYDAKFYKNFLSTYFTSSGELGSQTYLGFNAIAFPAICLLFFKRKPEEKPMRILFILSTLLLLFPAFGWLLNGLSYATNRWIWAYSLLVAYIVTTQWQKLRHITVGQAVACVGALALYSLLAIPLMTTDTRNIGVSVLLAFLIIVLCALAPKFKKKHLATALVLVLVLTSFTGNATYFYSSHGSDYASKFVTYDQVSKKLKNTDAKKVKKAAKKDDSFYRYSGSNLVYNTDLLAKTHSTSFYWSLQNPNIAQFINETELPAREDYMYKDLNGSAAQETYLRFTLKNYTDYPAYTYYKTQENDPLHRYSTEKWNKKDEIDQNLVKISARKFRLPSSLNLRFSAQTESGKTYKTNTLTCYSDAYVRYTGAKTYLVGLGYTDSAKKSITITFDERGIYDLADIEVLEQPVDDAKAQIAALSADTMQNVQMRANAITGTVDLKETKILCLSIPYSNGWTATVDGKKAELLQANTAFSALALEPGKHTVELHYHTPYLRTGACLSAAGVAAFAALIVITEISRKKKKQHPAG